MKHARRRVESEESFGLRDTPIWCGIPIVIVLLVRMFLFGFYVIPSGSMLNTIEPGDRVITSKLTPKSLSSSAATWWSSRTPTIGCSRRTAADSAATTSSNDLSACPVTPWHAKGPASRSRSTAWPSTKLRTSAPAWTPAPSRSVKSDCGTCVRHGRQSRQFR